MVIKKRQKKGKGGGEENKTATRRGRMKEGEKRVRS